MGLEVGDRVEVMNVWSRHMGQIGKILEVKKSKSPIMHYRVLLEDEELEQWFADVELT